MDTGGLDAVDGADGTGQFTLQRAQMIDVLDEAGGTKRLGLVENLVADAAAFGQVASASFIRRRVTLSFGTMITAPSLRSSKGIAWRSRSLMIGGIFGGEVGEQGGHLQRQ